MTISSLTLIRPDDWHLHLRDEQALAAVLPDTARQFARAIIMPNLNPPVTTVDLAAQYNQRIEQAMQETGVQNFTPLMTLYLTDNTTADEVHKQLGQLLIVNGVEYAQRTNACLFVGRVIPSSGKNGIYRIIYRLFHPYFTMQTNTHFGKIVVECNAYVAVGL